MDTATEQAFLAAFDEHADALFRHAYFRVSDRERAKDLVQDTFMRAWEYIARGEEIQQWKPFLYRVLGNLIIDEYRKKKANSLDDMLERDDVSEDLFEDLSAGGLDEVISALDAARLAELIHELPDTYREVIILRFVDGLSPKEIADFADVSENVISVRVHRGLKQLKEIFEYHGKDS